MKNSRRELFGADPAKEAIEIFRMIYASMGADTFGEQVLHNDDLEPQLQIAMAAEAAPASPDSKTLENVDEDKLEKPASTSVTKFIERLILGSICSGPNAFGSSKYGGYPNRKHSYALAILREGIERSSRDILPNTLALSCFMTLGRPKWLPEETFAEWLESAQLGGFLSFIDNFAEDGQYATKLKVMQIATGVKNVLEVVNVYSALNRIRYGTSRATESKGLVKTLRSRVERLGKDRLDSKQSESSLLIDLAPDVEKLDKFKELLSRSSLDEINARDVDGRTPILMACLYGNLEAARMLLSNGADAALSSYPGLGVLHCLPYMDPVAQSDFAKELLAAGANPNETVTLGLSIKGETSAMHPLVSMKCGTPLHHAILNNSVTSVMVLLFSGADGLLMDSDYITPLALSAALHCPEILNALILSTKTDVSTWADHFGNTLVFAALDGEWSMLRMYLHLNNYYRCAADTLKVLQKHGVNWNMISHRFAVPALRFAAFSSSSFVVSQLLELSLEDQINKDQPSLTRPLHLSIMRGDEHIFMLLLDNGADVLGQAHDGDTCLHSCIKAEFDDTFFIEILLERGAEIDAVDNAGRTAFYQAVLRKQFGTASYLLSHGADPEHKDVRVGVYLILRTSISLTSLTLATHCTWLHSRRWGQHPSLPEVFTRTVPLVFRF
jgi:ankyrin repeat protein